MKPLLPVALAVAMVSLGADDGRARFNIGASDPSNPCDPNAFWVNSTSGAMFFCAANLTWQASTPITSGGSITTGTVDPARLGSGGASNKYLRGDSTWQAIAGGGDLLAANNLSDLANAGIARTNLGLGTLATQSGTFSGTSSGTNTGDQIVPTYVRLTANRTNATTSYADITDLIIPVSANTRYEIECRLIYSANATTTGIGIGWTGPASPTLVGGQMIAGLTAATVGGTTSVGNDTGGVTTASVATSGNMATFKCIWSNGANAGNVQMRYKSEVAIANAIVIQAGSYCKYNVF